MTIVGSVTSNAVESIGGYSRQAWLVRLRSLGWRSLLGLVASLVLSLGLGFFEASQALAKGTTAQSELASQVDVALATLPKEARSTYRLIFVGGPFDSHKDGVVFGNRERILARKPKGFYHEYTVRTPGVRSRGARRIVCGGDTPTSPDVCYYSDDHYASFRRIVP